MKVNEGIVYGIGVFLIIAGVVIGFTWPLIFGLVSKEKLQLSNSSETYKLWVETPIPMYLDIYLFNWTNSQEFLKNRKIKPEFEEVGPFVFKEVHDRVNVEWDENNTVSYNQTRTWSFVAEESCDLSTPVYNLNVVASTVTKMALKYSKIIQMVLEFLNLVYKEKLLISRAAHEWLFDGIEDKLLNFVRQFMSIPFDKFGWFYGRNLSSSYDGRFSIDTGADNIFNLGNMKKWNYVNKTPFYDGECGVVKGSSGELFSPINGFKDSLSIFITDFCGSFDLKYSGLKSVEGLDGFHYVGDKSIFDNGTSNPSTKCYCSGECSPNGVRNVTSCHQAPIFISFPHFYLADPIFTESVGGMKPNKSEHEFYINIDPVTGIPLEVRAQVQLNVLLQPHPEFPMFSDVPRLYIPMMWFRQRAKVTPTLASRGKTLRVFQHLGPSLACGISVLGLLVIILNICFIKYHSKNKHFEMLIPSDEPNVEETENENSGGER